MAKTSKKSKALKPQKKAKAAKTKAKPSAAKPLDENDPDFDEVEGQAAPPLNSAAMQALITEGYRDRYNREQNIASLKKQYIEEPETALKKAKRDLKTETGVEGKDLELGYRVYKRAEDAKRMGDDDEARISDNLRDVFLSVKSQVDFFDVLTGGA